MMPLLHQQHTSNPIPVSSQDADGAVVFCTVYALVLAVGTPHYGMVALAHVHGLVCPVLLSAGFVAIVHAATPGKQRQSLLDVS